MEPRWLNVGCKGNTSESRKDMCEAQVPTLEPGGQAPWLLLSFTFLESEVPSFRFCSGGNNGLCSFCKCLSLWDYGVGCCQHIHLSTMAIPQRDTKPQCLEADLLLFDISDQASLWPQLLAESKNGRKNLAQVNLYLLLNVIIEYGTIALLVVPPLLPKPGPQAMCLIRLIGVTSEGQPGNVREKKVSPGWWKNSFVTSYWPILAEAGILHSLGCLPWASPGDKGTQGREVGSGEAPPFATPRYYWNW